ncbi:uncharacterized protein PPP1R15 [Halyomorpha halys]|uniref:uncharacterized protein PPP1R15 n=1 Tax=Halyomorpha halys TaxID=286706 RepID=UPI0006D4CFF8|nr:uncharacterized protein LOC106686009 [Halyomorpha halys]
MDYQFNLRQGAPRKFRISPVFSTPSFDRHFSSRANMNGCSCATNKEAVKPMLGMFNDFNASQEPLQKTSLLKEASKILPPMTSFPGSSSMAVSYIVGGIVGTNCQASSSSPQNICNLLDALVNSFQNRDDHKEGSKEPFPDTLHNSDTPTEFKTSTSEVSQVPSNPKRSYADVTKGIFPKPYVSLESGILPLNFTNIKCELNVCSNSMLTMYATNNCLIGNSSLLDVNKCSEHVNMSTVSENKYSAMPMANGHYSENSRDSTSSDNSSLSPEISADFVSPLEDSNPCTSAQNNPMKLPVSCLQNCRINRTVSECSVDSEDSFVVFQNDEDPNCDSVSDEECLSDDLDEVDNQKLFSCSNLALSPVKKNKKVSFKPDEKLVEIHTIVTWNYAHRAARVGPWETYARDRARFENRIQQVSKVLSPILEASHRAAVFQERFMEKN